MTSTSTTGVWENVIPLVLGWWYTAPPTDSGVAGVPDGATSTLYFARAALALDAKVILTPPCIFH